MRRTSDGKNIARSQFAYDRKSNSSHDRLQYKLQSARYRYELNEMLDLTRGKNSHYYYDYKSEEDAA